MSSDDGSGYGFVALLSSSGARMQKRFATRKHWQASGNYVGAREGQGVGFTRGLRNSVGQPSQPRLLQCGAPDVVGLPTLVFDGTPGTRPGPRRRDNPRRETHTHDGWGGMPPAVTDEDAALQALGTLDRLSTHQQQALDAINAILRDGEPFVDIHVLFGHYNVLYFRSLLLPRVEVLWSPRLTL